MNPHDAFSPPPGPSADLPSDSSPNGWRTVRWTILGVLAVVGSGLLFTGLFTASAGWYTSRSEFCNSCHIMEPYYKSWEESSHAHVACIKCHFPPGAAEKLRGKMLGLIQLAKYVTRSQGPRPVAEVSDASCLRSGCHETRTLAGQIDFHGIPFDHTPHMEHILRGKKLRCTSCHSQIVQGEHITVTTSTCFLCHFKDGHFNEGLGACTRCHQIPEESYDLGGGVQFTHELAYERGTDCRNCHADLIRGTGVVALRNCQTCHNRKIDLEKINDHEMMHQLHVTDHKVACSDCHDAIEHSLQAEMISHAASDCASCHPNHHQEQVNMLQGMGAETMPGTPAVMLTARVECRACHRVKQVSPTGTVLWKASSDVCTACHTPEVAQELQTYQVEMMDSLDELEATVQRVRDAIEASSLDLQAFRNIKGRLEKLEHDVSFLRIANGIHNIHYSNTLTHVLVSKIAELCRELDIPEPMVTLPKILPSQRDPEEA